MNASLTPSSSVPTFQLTRNPHGRLVLTLADGTAHEGVTPVRAFPIAAPGEGLSLVGADGHELLWVPRLEAVTGAARQLIEEKQEEREFVTTIQKILDKTSLSTTSTWDVETDRGAARLVLTAEEDIRRLGGRTRLLIGGGDGLQFRLMDTTALDKHSRRLLERFL